MAGNGVLVAIDAMVRTRLHRNKYRNGKMAHLLRFLIRLLRSNLAQTVGTQTTGVSVGKLVKFVGRHKNAVAPAFTGRTTREGFAAARTLRRFRGGVGAIRHRYPVLCLRCQPFRPAADSFSLFLFAHALSDQTAPSPRPEYDAPHVPAGST